MRDANDASAWARSCAPAMRHITVVNSANIKAQASAIRMVRRGGEMFFRRLTQ